MRLCAPCQALGYCHRLNCRAVTPEELGNPEIVRDIRAHAYKVGLTCDQWPLALVDAYRDYPGRILDAKGQEVMLPMQLLEPQNWPGLRYWIRDFACTPCPADVTPRVRKEAMERTQVFASILRAIHPMRAALWGVRAANDAACVAPAQAPVGAPACPCPHFSADGRPAPVPHKGK